MAQDSPTVENEAARDDCESQEDGTQVDHTHEVLVRHLRENNIELRTVLDIGCHTGDFAAAVKRHYPQCDILGIDNNVQALASAQFYCAVINATLSDDDRIVPFNYSTGLATGNSYYRELTEHFADCATIPTFATTLDDVLYWMRRPPQNIDLIKIDTQGSELDILVGAHNTLEKTKHVFVELPGDVDYNEDAPASCTTRDYLRDCGFENQKLIVNHYRESDNALINQDWLCSK